VVWEALDRLTLSLYADVSVPAFATEYVRSKCEEYGVLLTVKRIDEFQRMTPIVPLDGDACAAVHRGCWLRHRCHTLTGGRFFKCTRPPALHGESSVVLQRDGISLEAGDLREQLLAYLTCDSPLESCKQCLGSTGDWIAHSQATRPP